MTELKEPTTTKNKPFPYLNVIIILVLAVLTILLAIRIAQRQLGQEAAVNCSKATPVNHTVYIQDDKAAPAHVDAHQCDTLTVTNRDERARIMAFGVHDSHKAYDGTTTKTIIKDQSFTVNLTQTGQNFIVHDHEDEEVEATFTVTPL